MLLALGHWFELNHCGLINGLIGLLATAVFRDIVTLTMKIAKSWWLVGSGLEGEWWKEVGALPEVCMCVKECRQPKH